MRRLLSVLALLLALACPISAHDHHLYDADCCGNGDCEPVSAVSYVAADATSLPVLIVTTSLGTKARDAQTKIRSSKDGRMHACIHQNRLWCLYMPPLN